MKYETKPIDYTGCHPVIADHLKRGLAIECWVWDCVAGKKSKHFVVQYNVASSDFPYLTEGGIVFSHSEPIELKLKVKDPVSLMKALVEGGWQVNRSGVWVRSGHPSLTPLMWRYCSEPVLANDYNWDPEWLEEK